MDKNKLPPPLALSTLESLRQPRLLPRSIPAPLELQTQLLGVEFCATLSARMTELAQECIPTAISRPSTESVMAEPHPVMALLQDLSAHYGSHTLRRAASCPLGECFASRQRRASRGHHDGRRQLWSLKAAHRLWCRRCGLFLVAGETKVLLPSASAHCVAVESADSADNDNDDDDGGNTNKNIKNKKTGKLLSSDAPERNRARGVYVCRRCLNVALARRRMESDGLSSSPPVSSSGIELFNMDKTRLGGTGAEDASSAADCFWKSTMTSAAGVGRTRRRKRKRRDSVVPAKKSLLTPISKNSSSAAAASVIPKGSLFRGRKRTQAASQAPVETAAQGRVAQEPEKHTERRTAAVKDPLAKGHSAAMPSAPLLVAQVPVGPRKVVPKGRASGAGSEAKPLPPAPSEKKKKGSFADTITRLGL